MESILTSIKKKLGIMEDYKHFDADLIMDINSVFTILTQIGVGPKEGFVIEDEIATWTDFDTNGYLISCVESYIAMRVRLMFDPPANSFTIESINKQIAELEWRMHVITNTESTDEDVSEVVNQNDFEE